jgi:hypothetical protein
MMKKSMVIVDMDGCLNHYPDPLKMWAEMSLNLDQSLSSKAISKESLEKVLKKSSRKLEKMVILLPY